MVGMMVLMMAMILDVWKTWMDPKPPQAFVSQKYRVGGSGYRRHGRHPFGAWREAQGHGKAWQMATGQEEWIKIRF